MKTLLTLRLSLVLFFVLLAAAASAQTASAAPQRGYWNLETNLTTRNHTIVRFYNGQDQLVYEERLDNLCLDLSRRGLCRRTSRRLNVALQQVLRDPSAGRSTNLVAQQLGTAPRTPRAYAAR